MKQKRNNIKIGLLLVLVLILGYVVHPIIPSLSNGQSSPKVEPPLAGKNSISALKVHQNAQGEWVLEFDYFYTDMPRFANLTVELPEQLSSQTDIESQYLNVKRGNQHVSTVLRRPHKSNVSVDEGITTRQVLVKFVQGGQTLTSAHLDKVIEWPNWRTWVLDRELAGKTNEDVLKKAVALIDFGDTASLDQAKQILERIISKDSKYQAGYIELARIAMKSNWGIEGLHQAENLLSSALQINPDNSNAKILLGYVFSHQKRFKEAETLFTEVSHGENTNLWLWANWGELLAMQGKIDQASQKYREAVTRPMSHDTYDRARIDAYAKLILLLEQKKDIAGIEALLKQRVTEYGNGNCDCARVCYSAEYARFLLQNRNETLKAISLARQALDSSCRKDEAREVLGMAYYVAWANETNAKRNEYLNQARIYQPSDPHLLYILASNDRTALVVKQLIAIGESIDQRDNAKQSALALAFEYKDIQTARRLLKLGAKTDASVGLSDMPVALVPVLNHDFEGISLMRQFGVDYSKLRFGGITALEHAKQIGDNKLLDALDSKRKAI